MLAADKEMMHLERQLLVAAFAAKRSIISFVSYEDKAGLYWECKLVLKFFAWAHWRRRQAEALVLVSLRLKILKNNKRATQFLKSIALPHF